MSESSDIFPDLVAESEDIDRLVAGLDAEQWSLPTPASGWTIAHQIAHLAFVNHLARLAGSAPERFAAYAARAKSGFQAAVDAALAEYLADPPEVVLARWRTERAGAVEALAAVAAGRTVPWLANPLPPTVLAAAGLMEVFAHGQDIADALGVRRAYTDRIGHIAWFGTHTRDFGYLARGINPPDESFRFELTAPSGARWDFGPADAGQRITGPGLDFCLLVTRRRHRDDLALTAHGDEADRWLDIAQAYRGPAGTGRVPGQFAPA